MSTSAYSFDGKLLPNKSFFADKTIGLITSKWNIEVTDALYNGAIKALCDAGIDKKNIITKEVPGSFELPFGAQSLAKIHQVDAVICIGCIIQGETKHFDFISQAVASGIIEVSLKYDKPVIFGVLTTNTLEQAKERAGGRLGNKGEEAAYTALSMLV